ncbi:MAG: zinc dependent phospholipase C family protein [Eubacteriales bacterium]|nr:zinc dependent phospholipase C family protein [Eubacteriales bacterium]
MATWITHLRIAEKLLDRIDGMTETEFVVGNMAPDSGVPNRDWSVFTPNTEISHWRKTGTNGEKRIHIEEYAQKYLGEEQIHSYNQAQKSFYLGYYTHLLSDIYWAESVIEQSRVKYKEIYEKDKNECIWILKGDWYDLDYLYLKENGIFKTFQIYKDSEGFKNRYLDFFSEDAFDNRREYITSLYLAGKDGIDREYKYMSKEEMEYFVDESVFKIIRILKREYKIVTI